MYIIDTFLFSIAIYMKYEWVNMSVCMSVCVCGGVCACMRVQNKSITDCMAMAIEAVVNMSLPF